MRGLTLGDPALLGAAAGFSPLSLSPALWLDASDAATITSSSGKVSQWNDKSGNGRNVTQAISTLQPTTGTTTQNGLNVLVWGGTSAMRTANGVLNVGTLTVFGTMVSLTAARMFWCWPQAATTHVSPFGRFLLYHGGVAEVQIRINGTVSNGSNNSILSTVASYRTESSTGDVYVNNIRRLDSTGATLTYPNNVPFIIGANATNLENLNGRVAEIVVFDRNLTATETQQMETYMAVKWGL